MRCSPQLHLAPGVKHLHLASPRAVHGLRIRDVEEQPPRDECAAPHPGMPGAQEIKPAQRFYHVFFSATFRDFARVYAHLRLARLRQHHDVPGPLRRPHPAGPGASVEHQLPRPHDAAQLRRLRGQHCLRAETARRRRKDHGDPRRAPMPSSTWTASMRWVCRENMCACCPINTRRNASSPPISRTTRSPHSTRAR